MPTLWYKLKVTFKQKTFYYFSKSSFKSNDDSRLKAILENKKLTLYYRGFSDCLLLERKSATY